MGGPKLYIVQVAIRGIWGGKLLDGPHHPVPMWPLSNQDAPATDRIRLQLWLLENMVSPGILQMPRIKPPVQSQLSASSCFKALGTVTDDQSLCLPCWRRINRPWALGGRWVGYSCPYIPCQRPCWKRMHLLLLPGCPRFSPPFIICLPWEADLVLIGKVPSSLQLPLRFYFVRLPFTPGRKPLWNILVKCEMI